MERRLLMFDDHDEGHALLSLFVRASIPLQTVVAELPEINSFPMHVSALVHKSKITEGMDTAAVLNASFESSLNIDFMVLPEPTFERLALRFRPFYANKERINFLKVVNKIAAMNTELREHCELLRAKWKRAVFWGAMGMPEVEPKVNADKIIEAAFYSRYFHYDAEKEQTVAEYERALGKDMLRVAIVSSVWQRALLVIDLAEEICQYLIRAQILRESELSDMRARYIHPERVTLSLAGGVGALKIKPAE